MNLVKNTKYYKNKEMIMTFGLKNLSSLTVDRVMDYIHNKMLHTLHKDLLSDLNIPEGAHGDDVERPHSMNLIESLLRAPPVIQPYGDGFNTLNFPMTMSRKATMLMVMSVQSNRNIDLILLKNTSTFWNHQVTDIAKLLRKNING